ncbi:hypothetical protein [Aurantimonas endophytica]|uniref:Uncharacterized protein n=1 Tax=Aurantimonas endophytica TaxID=1522175 RepID=A0A7W6HFT7_9HYPH|nr:hypothetical protein [Aurantimonas endophytica]MBB4004454.1 hypothetical protein [Aurantimonas endophytica]MCO6405290.1 hypothetical protein [Aurantimonas endophytica]
MTGNLCPEKGKRPRRTGWLKNPKMARKGETIGGGWFVFRRGDDTGRIRPAWWPFEYGSQCEALAEAKRRSVLHPSYRFDVVGVAYSVVSAAVAQMAEAA